MRKTVGAHRSQLIAQFLGESFLVVLVAMVFAVALMELLLPVFEALIGKELNVSYADPATWLSLLLMLLANLLAWPAAAWAMLNWLQRFPYRIDALALIPLCVLAGAVALSIAWLTVAGNTVRVATTNPVQALRYE